MNETSQNTKLDTEAIKRRERLARLSQERNNALNNNYSNLIRKLRLILPLVAISIIAILLTWPSDNQQTITPTNNSPKAKDIRSVKKNELMSPRFESVDEKQQPYKITALRALQSDLNEDLVLLEKPFADMLLNSGNWIAIESRTGNFHQRSQKLMLADGVRVFHDEGYKLESSALHIDLKNKLAWSDQNVHIQGPAGTLDATGLKADNVQRILIFEGPAKLTLKREFSFSQPTLKNKE